MNKTLKISIFVIIVLLILDFIPIKFAVKLNNATYSENMYVCQYTTATEGNWNATIQDNPNLKEEILLNVESTSFQNLKEISDVGGGTPILNKYVFYGEVDKRAINEESFDAKVSFNWINVKHWDIVYPIKRQSFRVLYAPKSYLTIYDYDWWKVIKSWFTK